MSNGFVIAQSKSAKVYFTASSGYDRPQWKPITEATIYVTADLAQKAASKLWGYGSYGAKIVEVMDEPITPMRPDVDKLQDNPEDEMVAGSISVDSEDEVNLSDDDIEERDEDHPESVDEPVDNEFEENEIALSPMERGMMRGRKAKMPNGQGPHMSKDFNIGESVTKPTRPESVAKPSENKTIATDLPKPEKIKFSQQIGEPADVNFADDIECLANPHKTPEKIISDIKDAIKEFDDASEYNNGRDDAQASMALTISSALNDLLQDLNQGTQEGFKQAQIRVTSYMNPITTNFPPSLTDYLYKRGRQPMSLKNVFYDKWDSRDKSDL